MDESPRLLELFVSELQGHRRLARYPVRALRLWPATPEASQGCVVVSAHHTTEQPFLQITCTERGLTVGIDPAERRLLERLQQSDPPAVEQIAPDRIRIGDAGGLKRLIGVLLEHRLVGRRSGVPVGD